MAMEFQIGEAELVLALSHFVQRGVAARCFAPLLGRYVDHLDVVPGATAIALTADGKILARVPCDVFIVDEPALMASANAIPAGATSGAQRIVFRILLDFQGTQLRASANDPELPASLPPEVATPVKDAMRGALDSVLADPLLDTATLFKPLGMASPGAPSFALSGGVFAIRLGATAPFAARLAPGQRWGVFVDAATMVDFGKSKLPSGLPLAPVWAPDGSEPRLSVATTMSFPSPLPDVKLALDLRFSVAPGPALRVATAWSFDLDGGLIDGLFDSVEDRIRRAIRKQLLSQSKSEVETGPQSFYVDRPLPDEALLGARLVWANAVASAAGMTIGGPVVQHPADWSVLSANIIAFGSPVWWGTCRERAAAGRGTPPRTFRPEAVSVEAGVACGNAGSFCGATVLAPNEWLQAQLGAPAEGPVDALTSLGFRLEIGMAQAITAPVRIILRTARGVRLFDLGRPTVQLDAHGNVLGVQVNFIPDCLQLSDALLKLAIGEALTVADFQPPPLESPDWMRAIGASVGVKVQLVSLDHLQPNEQLLLESQHYRVETSADAQGRAIVPAVIPLSSGLAPVTLRRLSGRPVDVPVRVETVEFRTLTTLEPGRLNAVKDVGGVARLARALGRRATIEDHSPGAAHGFVPATGETALNPQPLPPAPSDALRRLAAATGFGDQAKVSAVPGFEDRPLALVDRGGGARALVVGGDHPRVAGEMIGPGFGVQTDGSYAIALSGRRLALFRVVRPEPVRLGG